MQLLYYISVKNSFETVTFYFLANIGFFSSEIIHGLSLELSSSNLFPTTKKRVLSKKRLTEREEAELYLTLNETAYLISNEVFENNDVNKRKYFNKFYEKIENLNDFLKKSQKILREEIKDDAYLNIFYDTFDSFYKISLNVKYYKAYEVSNKREAYRKFLDNMKEKEDATCYIVNPIDDSYIYLFDENSKNLIEHNIKLAKEGLNIELIFVVSKKYQLNDFIQKMVKRLISHNIIVRFALLDDIKKLSLDSYDFLCSNRDDILVYRNRFGYKYLYTITLSQKKIIKIQSDYKKIKKASYPLDKFLLYQKEKNNDILRSLVNSHPKAFTTFWITPR